MVHDQDDDAHVRIVASFVDPGQAYTSMGFFDDDFGLEYAACYAMRADRNTRWAFVEDFLQGYALYTRSVDGRGSIQAANVAVQRVIQQQSLFEQLLRPPGQPNGATPTPAEKTGALDRLKNAIKGGP